MRKIFLGFIFVFIITGLSWFFFWQKQHYSVTEPAQQTTETAEKAWIEVVNRGVYLVNEDDSLGVELKTGDEITSGQVVMTDNVGLANLYFSDGSVARLETQTRVDLKDFEYFPDKKTLKVKIFLKTGRVWSRIKALMTTESYWEVETTNAVAAVRGTSFGVDYVPGQTTIIGSKNLININAIDPQTKQVVEDNTAYIGEGQYIKINDQDIIDFKNGVKVSSKVKPYTQTITNDPWVIKSKLLDDEVSKQIATSTLKKPQADEEINTKPLNDQTQTSSASNLENTSSTPSTTSTTDYPDLPNSDNNQPSNEQNNFDNNTPDHSPEDNFYYPDDPTRGDLPDSSTEDNDPTKGTDLDSDFPDLADSNDETPDNENYPDPTHNSPDTENSSTTTDYPDIRLQPKFRPVDFIH